MDYEYLVLSSASHNGMRFCFCRIDLGCSSEATHSEGEILISLSHLCPVKQAVVKQQCSS